MSSKGSRFTLGVWGLKVCSLDLAITVATVRGRSREPSMAVPMVSSAKRAKVVTFVEVSNAAWPCFAWQAWHFVTVQHAS